jgi:hypothetical protein
MRGIARVGSIDVEGGLHLAIPTALEQAVRRRQEDRYPHARGACAYSAKSFLLACAHQTREPWRRSKKN